MSATGGSPARAKALEPGGEGPARTEGAAASGAPLVEDFYARPSQEVAQNLIGCTLLHDGVGGTIVETEAYQADDPACHAYVGRTARTEVIFGPPGRAYVYLCYGIHRMFNVITQPDGEAAAVLVRALEPRYGLGRMRMRRRTGPDALRELCSGPGKLCEALAIELDETHAQLDRRPFELLGRAAGAPTPELVSGPRIGITKAAELPWRYCLEGSSFLSRPAG